MKKMLRLRMKELERRLKRKDITVYRYRVEYLNTYKQLINVIG